MQKVFTFYYNWLPLSFIVFIMDLSMKCYPYENIQTVPQMWERNPTNYIDCGKSSLLSFFYVSLESCPNFIAYTFYSTVSLLIH